MLNLLSRLTSVDLRILSPSIPQNASAFGGFSVEPSEHGKLLQVDRGDGKGFIFLANDTTPGYIDTDPFPAAPTRWTYRAIYIIGDAQVGLWSKPVSVTVGA
jgi:hypothetical protein